MKSELRQAYKIACSMLPVDVHRILKGGIKRINAVPSLKGVRVKTRNGEIVITEEGNGWCSPVYDGEIFIYLNDRLSDMPEEDVVYTILHEFAHALEYLEDEDWRVETRLEARSELAANAQVAAWASRDASKPHLGGYNKALLVVRHALLGTKLNFHDWCEFLKTTS